MKLEGIKETGVSSGCRAILNGQTVVYLIHGNGTGALRTAIHKHLRGNRMVKSFRLGRYGEGESGVTVVELK